MGHFGGAGLHLAQLGAGAGEGHGLLGDLGAVEDIAVGDLQIVRRHLNGQGLLLHHIEHHVHRVAAVDGDGHAGKQGALAADLKAEGLFAAVADAGPVGIDDEVIGRQAADGVAVAGKF